MERFRLWLAAKLAPKTHRVLPYNSFAVIYDEEDPETAEECIESFYEQFGSPEEARRIFRDAFGDTMHRPRTVLILGEIDDVH